MARKSQPPKDAASPRMQEAWKLFDSGDKVTARREARAILAAAPSEDDAAQAKELLERTTPPLKAFAFAGFAATVMFLLILVAVLRT